MERSHVRFENRFTEPTQRTSARGQRWIDQSPRMIAQREMISSLFGQAPQGGRSTRAGAGPGISIDAGLAPVQAMRKIGPLHVSANSKYVVDMSDPNWLHVRTDAVAPTPALHFQAGKQASRKFSNEELYGPQSNNAQVPSSSTGLEFLAWEGKTKFGAPKNPNDCGMYANALALGLESWGSETDALTRRNKMVIPQDEFKKARLKGDQAGMDKAESNVFDPLDNPKDKGPHLKMDIGDMYELFFDEEQTKVLAENSPIKHHAATVVAKDGSDDITHEANVAMKLSSGVFRMYGPEKGDTFYEQHIGSFKWGKDYKGPESGILNRNVRAP